MMTAVTITEIAPTSSPTSVLRVCETKGKGYNKQVVLYYHMLEMFQLVDFEELHWQSDLCKNAKSGYRLHHYLFLDLNPIYVVAVSIHYYKYILIHPHSTLFLLYNTLIPLLKAASNNEHNLHQCHPLEAQLLFALAPTWRIASLQVLGLMFLKLEKTSECYWHQESGSRV